MLMVCHHLNPRVLEDVAFADSRIRAQTIMAEDILHDIGAFSVMSSDSQAMGRIGEVIIRTWQSADEMKRERRPLPGDSDRNDNARAKRYVAKYTINPAIIHGISSEVGSIEIGKLADLVIWKFQFFGVRPELIVKGGMTAWAAMRKANASIPTPQPVMLRPMFGSDIPEQISLTFTSRSALEDGLLERLGLRTPVAAVRNTRSIGKRDLILNDAMPLITFDPETYEVQANGELLISQPAKELPMAQRYFLF